MAHLFFERCESGTQDHKSFVLCLDLILLHFDLRLLLLDLSLLFFECVDEDGAEAIVLDAFDLTFLVAGDEQWLDLGDLLGDQAEVMRAAVFPVEGHRPQAVDEIQAAAPIGDVRLIAHRRRADGDLL